jgi:hypothetical protein
MNEEKAMKELGFSLIRHDEEKAIKELGFAPIRHETLNLLQWT